MLKSKSRRRTVNENIIEGVFREESEPVTIDLSPAAKANLEKLQLRSLDRQGRQPGRSQIIEWLINAAAIREPDAPYPG